MKVSRSTIFSLAAILVVATIALAACAPAPTPTPVPTPVPPTAVPQPTQAPAAAAPGAAITLNLGPGRDGDQTPATAVLTAQGDKTQVVLNIKSGGAGVSQPAHIHDGACPVVGGVKYPLTNVADGKSVTMVPAALADVLKGAYSINVHKSTSEAGVYVACGAVK